MTEPLDAFDALLDLDARHDELLRQLDDLDHRVQKVLGEYLPAGGVARLCGRAQGQAFPAEATSSET
jgi:tetrahydromethanopterin S-methyltransferase subunit G